MRARRALPCLCLAALLTVAGCSGGGSAVTPSTGSRSSIASSIPSSTAPPTPSATSSAPVSRATTTATVPCPYLDGSFVMQTVGQHLSAIVVTTTTPPEGPLPQCDFQRSSGESVTTVRTLTEPDATSAQDAALAVAPDGNPVTDIGDGGVVKVAAGSTTLAVSKGAVLLTVVINQESSLQARAIAQQVVTQL